MFCRYCGQEIPNDSMVCTYCGKKLKKSANSRVNDTDTDEKTLLADLKSLRLSKKPVKKEEPKYELPPKKRVIKTKYIESESDNQVEIINTPAAPAPMTWETSQPAVTPTPVFETPVQSAPAVTPVMETPAQVEQPVQVEPVQEQAPVQEEPVQEVSNVVEETPAVTEAPVQEEPAQEQAPAVEVPAEEVQAPESYTSEADKQLMDLFGLDNSQPEVVQTDDVQVAQTEEAPTQPEVYSDQNVEVPEVENNEVNVAQDEQPATESTTTEYVPTEEYASEQNTVGAAPGFAPLVIEEESVVSPDQMNQMGDVQNQEQPMDAQPVDTQYNQDGNVENSGENMQGGINYDQLAAREQAYVQQMDGEPQGGSNNDFNFNPDNKKQKQPKIKKDKSSRSNALTIISLLLTIALGLFFGGVILVNNLVESMKALDGSGVVADVATVLTDLLTENFIVIIVLAVIVLMDLIFAIVQLIRKSNAFAWINFILCILVLGAIAYGVYATNMYELMFETVSKLFKK